MRVITLAGLIFATCVALSAVTRVAQAAPLTLGCSGTLTTTQVPKEGVANDPEKENVVDLSVVIDFEQRTVSGFLREMSGINTPLPITAVDANSVTFKGSNKESKSKIQSFIDGTVDRITGKIDAEARVHWGTGSFTIMSYDLRCKPTTPLF